MPVVSAEKLVELQQAHDGIRNVRPCIHLFQRFC